MAEAPIASHEGGQVAVKALNASHLPTTDGVDKLYRQLVEIHAITAAQLAECPCWHRSDSTPSLVRARNTGRGPMRRHPRQGHLHRYRLTSPPKPRCGSKAHMSSPQGTDGPIR
jgi:hypothetical protein